MNQRERFVIASILILVTVLVALDIYKDFREGVLLWHAITEGIIALLALFGVFYILRGSVLIKRQLENEIENFSEYKKEAELWRADSKKYIDGLALAIDHQLSKWKLSVAEKEVAFLLLKGFSLKEIAEIRSTTEKTARVQSMAIYQKAGLAGRAELSAFFLEDLLLPSSPVEENSKDLQATIVVKT